MRLSKEELQALGYRLDGDTATRIVQGTWKKPEAPEIILHADRPPAPLQDNGQPAYRSKLEARYAMVLDQWQHEGRVDRWWYEAVRLALAPRTTFTPDFMLVRDNAVEFHETKGFKRDDAMVKAKVAAAFYPMFRFYLVTWQHQSWHWQEVPHG